MAGANVVEFTTENWEQEVVNSPIPVLVDFWAPWCGPCRNMSPAIDKVAEQFAGKVKVGKLNIDENESVAVRYGISSIPEIFIFKGGDEPKRRVVGSQTEPKLVKLINESIGA